MTDPLVALPLALLLLAGNAFFVGAEFSLVSARRSAIEPLAQQGSRRAKIALYAMENLSVMLAGAQLGITLCSLGLGILGKPVIAHLLEGPFYDLRVPEQLVYPLSFVIALTIVTYLHVVLGEMVPKNLALTEPDRGAMLLASPMNWAVRLLKPAVVSLSALATAVLRLFGIEPKDEVTSTFTRDEVAGFVEESHREGLLSSDEEQLLAGALRFDEATVRTLVIPLDQLVTLNPQVTPAQVEQASASSGFSRFPIRNRRGRLTGYIHLKDVLGAEAAESKRPVAAGDIRPLASLQTTDSLHLALTIMRQTNAHLARVSDRRGRQAGVVTMEDVLEQLVGEINDYRPTRRTTT